MPSHKASGCFAMKELRSDASEYAYAKSAMHAMPELSSASCSGTGTCRDCIRETRPSLVSRSELASMLRECGRRNGGKQHLRKKGAAARHCGHNQGTASESEARAHVPAKRTSAELRRTVIKEECMLRETVLFLWAMLLAGSGPLPVGSLGACRAPADLYR